MKSLLGELRHRLSLAATGESPRTYFDIGDDAAICKLLALDSLPSLPDPVDWSSVLAWQARGDLREVHPLGLTPAGRRDFLKWCTEHGEGWGASTASAIAALRSLDARPDRGLVASYRFQPAWQQRHPRALTVAGWKPFIAWIADEYRCPGRWLERAELDPTDIAVSAHVRGVNLIALWRYVSGLREVAVQYDAALTTIGVPVAKRALPSPPKMGTSTATGFDDPEVHPVTIAVTGAVQPFDALFAGCGLHPRDGIYRIASWAWELEDIEPAVLDTAKMAREFWTLSEFGAIALRKIVHDRAVIAMPPSVTLPAFAPQPRSHFGLPDDAAIFLATFDLSSIIERKNPLGTIEAFRRAFGTGSDAYLVLKVNRAESFPAEFGKICEAIAGLNGTILAGVWPKEELLALMACCDAAVSLHRSEGFGYTVAEAMLLGKPAIATDYSATAEFLNAEVGLPVNWTRATIPTDAGPYRRGWTWAEPDVDQAAERMRWVRDHRDDARTLGERARIVAEERFAVAKLAARMAERLNAIGAD